jgi:hypothetical protein
VVRTAYDKQYYQAHREAKRSYDIAHRERRNAVARIRRQKKSLREYNKAWRAAHKDDVKVCLNKRLNKARSRAIKLKVPFELTKQHLYDLYAATPYCAISGLPFDLHSSYATISLDRIVPAKGYVIGNVRLVRWIVNAAMCDWGEGPLIEIAEAIVARKQTL